MVQEGPLRGSESCSVCDFGYHLVETGKLGDRIIQACRMNECNCTTS